VRAILIRQLGGPEQLEAVELPDPKPGSGEVLIAVAAVGVNRVDVGARNGNFRRAGQPPLLPGVECAGTIVEVGEGVTGLAVGERVVATGEINGPGFYAELAAVPATNVVPVPDGVDLVAAAAVPGAWLCAWYCLRRLAELRRGEVVLIHAAASGVGSAAVQIALDAGAQVIATVGSPAKAEWVRQLGAHHVLDTSALTGNEILDKVARLTEEHGADVVVDTVGGETFPISLRAAAFAGRVVALANVAAVPSTIDTRDFYPKNVRILGFQISSLIDHGYDPQPDLAELLAGLASGRFTVPIDATFPLSEAANAHRRLESRATHGKLVLTI
jgi:NADPH2:quinone reductase